MNDETTKSQREKAAEISAASPRSEREATKRDGGNSLNKQECSDLLEEADAMAYYIARNGEALHQKDGRPDASEKKDDLPEGTTEGIPLTDEEILYKKFLEAIIKLKSNCSLENQKTLLELYRKITEITHGRRKISGRTILDTIGKKPFWHSTFSAKNAPISIGVIFFVTALVLELLAYCTGRISDPSELAIYTGWAYYLNNALYPYLMPALWGGLGACIYLARYISHLLHEMTYEEHLMHGVGPRIFLGAMFGVIFVSLFYQDLGERIRIGERTLEPIVVAFLAGLFTRPVYALLKRLMEALTNYAKAAKPASKS